jgi:hypothetical protein
VAQVSRAGEWYTVMVNGQMIGQFCALLDANRYALMMLQDGLVDSVRLVSGEIIK